MILLTLLLASAAAGAVPTNITSLRSEPKTADAVIAADKAWEAAEMRGDAAYVDWLLLPDYRSVSPDGTAYPKSAIVRSALARADPTTAAKSAADHAAWLTAHPVRGDVSIMGDTAVLTWVSTKPGPKELVSSCDIFVYRASHWHGIYSQHSAASA